MRTRNVAVSVLVLSFSMFGVVGFLSAMVSPTPIVKVISSGLILFSYANIAILSKRMRFKELFMTLIPLNLINIVRSYADLGLLILKYQGSVGELMRLVSQYTWLCVDARAANQTVTAEMINQTLGPDGIMFIQGLNNTGSASTSFMNNTGGVISGLPLVSDTWRFFTSLPEWIGYLAFAIIGLYMVLDSIIIISSNIFGIISTPIIMVLGMGGIILFRANVAYLYVMWMAWIPIAATVDSFLRIYLFRALFFRFMKKHPLIRAYSEGGYL